MLVMLVRDGNTHVIEKRPPVPTDGRRGEVIAVAEVIANLSGQSSASVYTKVYLIVVQEIICIDSKDG